MNFLTIFYCIDNNISSMKHEGYPRIKICNFTAGQPHTLGMDKGKCGYLGCIFGWFRALREGARVTDG